MKKGLLLSLVFLFLTLLLSSSFAETKGNKVTTHVFEEKGMRHSMSIMTDAVTGKKVVVDTIEHCNSNLNAYGLALSGAIVPTANDTLTNWYWFAADTATILAIQAQFATTGTGNWNVWPAYWTGTRYLPATQSGQLLFDVPWQITQADTDATGLPNLNWQTYDLEGNGLSAELVSGAYVGYYPDASTGPRMFMDSESDWGTVYPGHPFEDWYWSRTYSADDVAWYIWWNGTNWYEYVMRIIVRYERVAPSISSLSTFQDYFDGNPVLDVTDKTVSANIVDLDGTVAGANLRFTVAGTIDTSTVAMSNVGDTYSADFGVNFTGGDTVEYWIESTDNEANLSISSSRTFNVVTPATANVLFVVDGGDGGEIPIEQALVNHAANYYVWNADDHGGISSYEINYGFDNIVWYGFGGGNMASPFGTDASSGVATYLDNGGNLMLLDKDYLFANGYQDSVLFAGHFAYDYLGMADGFSDPAIGDTVYYGFASDPISGAFLVGADSLVTMPTVFGTWSTGSATDWSDYVNANSMASAVFYTDSSTYYGYDTAIRYAGSGFATAFFPMGLESAAQAQVDAVVGNTLDWFAVVSGVGDKPTVANSYQLAQNYPNPFNPTTQISFSLKIAGKTELTVYNALGQKVITLVNNEMTAGAHNVDWNGLDASGKAVATGVYIYKLKSGDFSSTRKMLLIK